MSLDLSLSFPHLQQWMLSQVMCHVERGERRRKKRLLGVFYVPGHLIPPLGSYFHLNYPEGEIEAQGWLVTHSRSNGWSREELDFQSRCHCQDRINLIKYLQWEKEGAGKFKSRPKKRFIAEKIGRSLSDVEWSEIGGIEFLFTLCWGTPLKLIDLHQQHLPILLVVSFSFEPKSGSDSLVI